MEANVRTLVFSARPIAFLAQDAIVRQKLGIHHQNRQHVVHFVSDRDRRLRYSGNVMRVFPERKQASATIPHWRTSAAFGLDALASSTSRN
jgi:hypothetical protein